VRVTGRIVRWQPSLCALGLIALVMWRTNAPPDADRTLTTLLAVAALAPILVDPAAVIVASSPTPLRTRFAYRLVWIAPAVVGWIVAQWIFVADPHRVLPPRWVWLEFVSAMAIVLAAELVTTRAARATGLTGLATLFSVVAVVVAVSRYVAILPVRENELRVTSIGAVAIAACWIASRDPALRDSAFQMNRGRRSPRQFEKERSNSEGTWKSAHVGSSPRSPRS
jgi:hypothetical protein